MGLFSRLFVPRGVRRAMHPVRTTKRAVTPKSIKQLQRAASPLDNARYSVERSLNTKTRPTAQAWQHGNCPVKHRTPEAAARCRNR